MTRAGAWWGVMALLAMAVGAYAIALMFVEGLRPPIVRELLVAWPVAAMAHFLGGGVAMILGAFQVNARLRARYLGMHRGSGRVYLAAVLVGGIGGFILALDSWSGPVGRVGFALLALLWISTSAMAYLSIRRRDLAAHRAWMVRSYALTLAAVTLRIYLPAAVIGGLDMTFAYPAIAWLCWVPNLAIAEWLLRAVPDARLTARSAGV